MLQSRPLGSHETFELSIDPKGVNPPVPAQQDYPCAFPAFRLGLEASVLSASSGRPGAAGGVSSRTCISRVSHFTRSLRSWIPGWPFPSSPCAYAGIPALMRVIPIRCGWSRTDAGNKVEHPFQGERLVAAWASGMTRTQLRQSRAPGGRPSRHSTHDVWQRGLAAPYGLWRSRPPSLAARKYLAPYSHFNQ